MSSTRAMGPDFTFSTITLGTRLGPFLDKGVTAVIIVFFLR